MDNPSTSEFLIIGSQRCLLVDTGLGAGNLKALVEKLCQGKPYIVVNTHGHFDHCWGNDQFEEIFLSKEDEPWVYKSFNKDYKEMIYQKDSSFFQSPSHLEKMMNNHVNFKISYLTDGCTFDLGDTIIECIHTPGHTIGSYSFLDVKNKRLFTGDEILRFESLANGNGASIKQHINTIQKLLNRKDDISLFIGAHGHRTDGFRPLTHEYLEKMLQCIYSFNLKEISGPGEHFIDEETYEFYLNHKQRSDYDAVSITISKSQYEQYLKEKD